MKIALGTTSKYKRSAVLKVLSELNQEVEIIACDVPSGISDQPNKAGETKLGSINRAQASMDKTPDADFGLGVEFGYEPTDDGKYKMVCFASVVTKEGETFSESSSTLELPVKLQEAMEKDIQVFSLMDELTEKLDHRELKRESIHFLHKRRVIDESVMSVMLRYLLIDKWY